MNENDNERHLSGLADGITPSSDSSSTDKSAQQAPLESPSQIADAVTTEAKALGNQALHAAEGQAEKVKEATASHLDVFADALRIASSELSKNHPGPTTELISQAASGLEGLSRSLHGRSTREMIETARQFGRDNPVAFLAGSVLAGLALGRFATSANATKASSDNRDGKVPPSFPFGGGKQPSLEETTTDDT